jgi:uncharacterized membrane protein (UPF0127 family)
MTRDRRLAGLRRRAMTRDRRLAALRRRALPGGLTLLVAGDRRSRGRGLARLDALPAGHALHLERCRSVHTLGMRFALDLLWLDADGGLVRLDRGVGPGRLRTCLRARSVIEATAGDGERLAAALELGADPRSAR